ncbi:MAG: hypothetical protein R3F47_18645 [Gammaproteobacteria bacterium]
MKPVAVAKLLRRVYNDALAINDDKQHQIELHADDNVQIFGDDNELRSAFSNLMVNTVEATRRNRARSTSAGGPIRMAPTWR